MKEITKNDLARQLVEKYLVIAKKEKRQFSKKWMANVLYNENPSRFKDEEDARHIIRTITHCGGNDKKFKQDEDLARRFLMMPEAVHETETSDPFIIPTTIKKTLVIADIHGKFYNREAFEIAVEYGVKQNCDSCIIDGDFMDFYGDSKFDKNPLIVQQMYDEQEWGQDILELLQDVFGYVVLKEGNHDIRRERCIGRMATQKPELMEMASYKDYLFFDGCHVNFVEDYRHIEYGELAIIHGHEYYGGGGIHVAYNRYNKALVNLMSAHSHVTQHVTKKNLYNKYYGSWTLGCLCQLDPRYSPKNNWNNGFAIIEKDSSGEFDVNNRMIDGNKSRTA